MPLYRNADKIALFVHIPKTGGSTVEEVLKASGAPQALKYHKRLGYSFATPQHMQWRVTKLWIPEGFYDYGFTVVRNPFARIVSEYRWRQTISKVELPDFDTWLNRVFDVYEEHRYIHDNHIRPQNEFVGDGIEVFRLEDGLERPVRAGLTALGLPADQVSIHHARKSKHSPVPVRAATMARCTTFYAKDFETFGYSEQDVPQGLFEIGSLDPVEAKQ